MSMRMTVDSVLNLKALKSCNYKIKYYKFKIFLGDTFTYKDSRDSMKNPPYS